MKDAVERSERGRIDHALIELCLERTYANVTLSMLLDRTDVDLEAFERHYEDLEDCFCRIYTEMRDDYMLRVAGEFAEPAPWREQMRRAAYVTLDYLREDLARARITFVEVLYAGDRAKLIRDEAMQGLFALVDQGRNEPTAPAGLSRFTAEAIGSAVYQRIQTAIEKEELDAFEDGVREMMYMVVLPYLGEEAAREELEIPPPLRSEGAAGK